jgi:hypothetical protein
VIADADLALTGITDLDILPDEDLGTAGLVEADCFGHHSLLQRWESDPGPTGT